MKTERLKAALLQLRHEGFATLTHAAGAELFALEESHADMARALKPLADFVAALDAQPMRGIDDVLYSIHGGASNPGVGAEIRLSDLRRCVAALKKADVL